MITDDDMTRMESMLTEKALASLIARGDVYGWKSMQDRAKVEKQIAQMKINLPAVFIDKAMMSHVGPGAPARATYRARLRSRVTAGIRRGLREWVGL